MTAEVKMSEEYEHDELIYDHIYIYINIIHTHIYIYTSNDRVHNPRSLSSNFTKKSVTIGPMMSYVTIWQPMFIHCLIMFDHCPPQDGHQKWMGRIMLNWDSRPVGSDPIADHWCHTADDFFDGVHL